MLRSRSNDSALTACGAATCQTATGPGAGAAVRARHGDRRRRGRDLAPDGVRPQRCPELIGGSVPAPLPVTSAPPRERRCWRPSGTCACSRRSRAEGVTAVGFHGSVEGALVLQPVGPQANEGLVARLWRKITGSSRTGLAWYQLGGGTLRTLDVGAVARTDVYSPVDGTVVTNPRPTRLGPQDRSRDRLRPTSAPSLVVTIQNVRPDTGLAVGANVDAGSSKLGRVADIQQSSSASPSIALPQTAGTTSRSRCTPRQRSASPRFQTLESPPCASSSSLTSSGVTGPDRAPGSPALVARRPGDRRVRREQRERCRGIQDHASPRGPGARRRGRRVTLGNHAFQRAEVGPYLDNSDRVVRPANMSKRVSGRGLAVVPTANGARLAVVNVLESLFLDPATSMFEVIDDLVDEPSRDRSSSSTSTRKRRARRSRSPAGSTGESRRWSERTRMCGHPTRASSREAPHSSPTPA